MSTRQKTTVFIAVLLASGFFIPISYAQTAGVIFEDNFDDQPDWTIRQPARGSGDIEVCYFNCNVPNGWDSYYNGVSFCDVPGHNTLNVNSEP